MILGIGQLRLCRAQGALAAAQGGLGGVEFALAGVTLGQQFLLTHERCGALLDPCLLGDDLGLSGIDVGLQILGIEFGQHLPGADPVADIDHALDDLATDPERQFGLHPGLHIAGQGHGSRVIGGFDLLHKDPWQVLRRGFFLPQAVNNVSRLSTTTVFNPGLAMQTPSCVRTCK